MKALNKSEVKVHLKRVCGALWMLLARVSRGNAKSGKPFGQSAFQNCTVQRLCDRDKTSVATGYLKVIMKTNSAK